MRLWSLFASSLLLLVLCGCSRRPSEPEATLVDRVVDAVMPRAAAQATPPVVDLYTQARAAALEVLVDDHLTGSGFVVTPEGLAITAAHVVGAGQRLEVRTPGGRLPVQLVATDRGHDLALVRLPTRSSPYPALRVAARVPRPGHQVFLYGAPMFRHGLLLAGSVAVAAATYEFLPTEAHYVRVFAVSGRIQPGTSGAPWLDTAGQVVGMQSAQLHDGGASAGIAAMVPPDAITALLQAKRSAHTPTLGLGLEEVWEQESAFLRRLPARTEGVVVARVRRGGPGETAGLRTYDVITRIDGAPMRLRDTALGKVRAHEPGDRLRLTVLRPRPAPGQGTESLEVLVTLARLESLK